MQGEKNKMTEEKNTIDQMKKLIKDYENKNREKDKKPVTMGDLKKLMNDYKKPNATVEIKPVKKEIKIDEKKQIAYQIYKDAKTTSIVCLIAITFPLITTLIGAINVSVALIIGLIGIIYPCLILVKSISIQTRAYKKYGFRPIFMFPQQTQYNKKDNDGMML